MHARSATGLSGPRASEDGTGSITSIGPPQLSDIIKCTLDFSSLSTFLSALQNEQHSLNEKLGALESTTRTAGFNARAVERDVQTLQKDQALATGSLGELRVAVQKVRAATENLPSNLGDYCKRGDLPCTRAEWESLKLLVGELKDRADRPVAQTSQAQAEVASLKAEVAELTVKNETLAKTVRDIQNLLRNREDEALGAGRKSDLHHTNATVAAAAEKAIPNRQTHVVPGETAAALLELGVKKRPESAAAEEPVTPKAIEVDPDVTTPTATAVPLIDHSPAVAALEQHVRSLQTSLKELQEDLTTVRQGSNKVHGEVVALREGFKDIHASMPIPFVAPTSTEDRERPLISQALQPTMIAVSLQCDLCSVNPAVVFCVHCLTGSQKLCAACDGAVHAAIAPVKLPGEGASKRGSVSGLGSTQGTATSASKHLRLEISKTIQPGSKLLSTDLGFIKNQSDSAAISNLQDRFEKVLSHFHEISERVDRHDLQFGALTVALNEVDEHGTKLSSLDKDVKSQMQKYGDLDRAGKELGRTMEELSEKVENILSRPGPGVAGIAALAGGLAAAQAQQQQQQSQKDPSLAQLAQVSNTNNPVTAGLAKQLHQELDAHKKQTNHAFLDLVAKLDTFQSVQLDAITAQIRQLERNKLDVKSYLALTERTITVENGLRSLSNSQLFTSKKLETHLEDFSGLLKAWTCMHCDTHSLATGGICAAESCKRRICLDCSRVGRGGHVSELGRVGGGFGGMGSGSDISSSQAAGPLIQAARDAVEGVAELRGKVNHLYAVAESGTRERKKIGDTLGALLDMTSQLQLILPNLPPAGDIIQAQVNSNLPPLKFGSSAALLLDPRTLGYFESLSEFFNHSLPNMLHRLGLNDQRAEVFSSSLSALERRNREFEVASRPFVEEKVNSLGIQIGLVEKNTVKKLKLELKRFEGDFLSRLEKQKEDEKKMGLESSIARVTFRCVACDQPVATQPGPLSKEYQAQLDKHNALFHPQGFPQPNGQQQQQLHSHSNSLVAGFSSVMPPLTGSGPGTLAPSTVANAALSNGLAVIPTERGHLFIDPGQRVTLHSNTDSTVYRGREDTRISFTPAQPTGSGDQRQSATFQTAYAKTMVQPSGSTQRSVGRTPARGHGGRRSDGLNAPSGWSHSQTQLLPHLAATQQTGAYSARGSASNAGTQDHEARPHTSGGRARMNEEKFGAE